MMSDMSVLDLIFTSVFILVLAVVISLAVELAETLAWRYDPPLGSRCTCHPDGYNPVEGIVVGSKNENDEIIVAAAGVEFSINVGRCYPLK